MGGLTWALDLLYGDNRWGTQSQGKSNFKSCLKIRPLQRFVLKPLVHFTPVDLLLAREEDSF
jgi:hypothetical protein